MDVPKEIEEKISPYIQKGENIKFINIKYNDKIYKEIQFRKKAFGRGNYILKGILYLSEENEVVKSGPIVQELGKLSFHYKNIFDRDNRFSLISTHEDEGAIKRQEDDFQKAINAINLLKDDINFDIEKMKSIIQKVISIRKQKNESIEKIIKLEEVLKSKNYVFGEEMFSKSYSIFEDILRENFKSIRLIYSTNEYYDEIKRECTKKKRGLSIRFNLKIKESFYKLDYVLGYFKKIIKTYSNIVDFNENSYIKFIRNKHNEIIKENLNGLRG
ncbi:hypothetical protein [Clostridium lundense]|uniref:hypothetical protein n=1 Tax=Clostridium lundense TaxID=319475 RepID=UPI00048080F2|nr:hypothetical protein [Clostridium lundense]